MSAPCSADDPRTRLLITVDTESTMAGLRPLDPDVMVYGRLDGGTYGIERIMDCCEARGFRATFFVSTLEALHHGDAHVARMCAACLDRGHDVQLHVHPNWWKANFERKRLTDYPFDEQLEVIAEAIAAYRRACGTNPIAHRAGGLLANATTFRVLKHFGIPIDASVAPATTPTASAPRRPTCPGGSAASPRCPSPASRNSASARGRPAGPSTSTPTPSPSCGSWSTAPPPRA